MAAIFDCSDPAELLAGMRAARASLKRGQLAVIPTDTVYGIAADAFRPDAVARLLAAKGRDRQAPPPVLVSGKNVLDALVESVPEPVSSWVDALWPGGLTVILPARSFLAWDLGETHGTVAVRVPDNTYALELLAETGPLAVSSANTTGDPAAHTAAEAERMLGESVEVYLRAGRVGSADAPAGGASTIVDATALASGSGPARIVRAGIIGAQRLRELAPDAFDGAEA